MNNLDKQYQELLQDILDNGVEKKDRTGTGTKSIFGYTIRHNMSEGFPVLTTKKMAWKTMVTELLWFLRGDTNIKFLVDNNCHIWDGDCFANYLKTRDRFSNKDNVKEDVVINGMNGSSNRAYTQEEFINKIKTDDEFAKKWGDLGPVYGKQWRNWGERKHDSISNEYFIGIDQITNLINDLKTNPDSRRLMVNAWNVGELDQMTLPPCHYGFQVYTRELSLEERTQYKKKRDGIARTFASYTNQMLDNSNIPTRAISLMWNQRSVDTFLGLPFNIASYGLLLEIIAKTVNMVPDELIGNLGDTHLYLNHIEQAKEQIGRQMTWEEKIQWVIKNTDIEMDNVLITEESYKKTTPTHTREPYQLPTLNIHSEIIDYDLDKLEIGMFTIENYQSHPSIKAQLSN